MGIWRRTHCDRAVHVLQQDFVTPQLSISVDPAELEKVEKPSDPQTAARGETGVRVILRKEIELNDYL